MKTYRSILVILSLILVTISFSSCSNKTIDEQFKDDLTKGLSARWEISSKQKDTVDLYEKCIEAEYDILSKYKEEAFEDKELGELAKSYIDILEKSKQTLKYFNDDEKWVANWDSIYKDRLEILFDLNDKLDLQFSKESDKEEFNGLLSEGQLVKDVRNFINTTKFKKTKSDYGWNTYSAVVENTTDQNFSYFSFEIKLLDKDGVTIETQYASTDNWNSGDKAKFYFETNSKFKTLKIEQCNYLL